VSDLLQSLPEDERAATLWRRTSLLLCTPILEPTVYLAEPEETLEVIGEQVAVALLDELGLGIPPHLIEILPYGHVAFALGAERARAYFSVGTDRTLVVAVDSMLDPLLLENLASQGRIKHAGNPVGFAPGEAAIAMLLVNANNSRRTPAATITGFSYDLTPRDVYGPTDRALADICTSALASAGLDSMPGDVYVDLTGEVWRARQWGDALPHLIGKLTGNIVLPAVNVGDTGAASSALAVCLAARSFARGYAKADHAAIISMGENGSVACVVVARTGVGAQ
jgi:3-oxoacyl-[acyl-carrier-protein] synthase-1